MGDYRWPVAGEELTNGGTCEQNLLFNNGLHFIPRSIALDELQNTLKSVCIL